jgi:hypothetical protein
VFKIIQGQTRDSVVDIDVEHVWDVCWNRIATLFNISLPCNWVVSTALDFFHRSPQLVAQAQEFPAVAVHEVAVTIAARNARLALDSVAFANAALQAPPQQRIQVVGQSALAPSGVLQEFTNNAAEAVANAISELAGPHALDSLAIAAVPAAASEVRAPAQSPVQRRRTPEAEAAAAPVIELILQPAPPDIALNPFWPAPTNLWMAGAKQCALCCNTCRIGVWQSTHRGMLNHYRNTHGSVCQLTLKESNVSGPENVVVVTSCWCIRGMDGDGNASTEPRNSWIPCKRSR